MIPAQKILCSFVQAYLPRQSWTKGHKKVVVVIIVVGVVAAVVVV